MWSSGGGEGGVRREAKTDDTAPSPELLRRGRREGLPICLFDFETLWTGVEGGGGEVLCGEQMPI
jgi:hypothetical protein